MENKKIKGNLLIYADENDFNKKMRAIRKYCMGSYKNFIFNIIPELKRTDFENGTYRKSLVTDKMFKCVYGEMELIYSVRNGVIILEDLVPGDILTAMHKRELECYKGVPIRDKKDIIKIKMAEALIK